MNDVVAWVVCNWANILAWSIEFLMVLLWIHCIFGVKFKLRIFHIVLIAIDVITFSMIWAGMIPEIFTSVTYIISFGYCITVFKRRVIETVGRYVLSIIMAMLVETVVIYIVGPIELYLRESQLLLSANIISLFIALFLTRLINVKKKKVSLQVDKKFVFQISVSGIFIILMVAGYRYLRKMDNYIIC